MLSVISCLVRVQYSILFVLFRDNRSFSAFSALISCSERTTQVLTDIYISELFLYIISFSYISNIEKLAIATNAKVIVLIYRTCINDRIQQNSSFFTAMHVLVQLA